MGAWSDISYGTIKSPYCFKSVTYTAELNSNKYRDEYRDRKIILKRVSYQNVLRLFRTWYKHDVACGRRFISRANRLLVQNYSNVNNEENINDPNHWPTLCSENSQITGAFATPQGSLSQTLFMLWRHHGIFDFSFSSLRKQYASLHRISWCKSVFSCRYQKPTASELLPIDIANYIWQDV